MTVFTRAFVMRGSAEDAIAAALGVIALVLLVRLRSRPRAAGFDPRAAWLRAGIYFCACGLAGWGSGVVSALMREPLASVSAGGGTTFVLALIGMTLFELVAYWGVWRAGTLHHGRPRNLPAQLGFGALWGVCEGVLMLSVWAVAEATGIGTVWVALVTFAVVSAWLGGWHATYWDRKVVPEHNIPAWNLPKVLIAHVPNLALSLAFFAAYRCGSALLLFQAVGLCGATLFMRFPGWNWSRPAAAIG